MEQEKKEKKLKIQIDEVDLARIEALLAQTTQKFIDELPHTIQLRLEQAVARLVGFEKDTWSHEWKVDHCNGRMSVISELIGTKAKAAARAAADQLTFQVTPEIQQAIDTEYAARFKDEMRDQLRSHVHRTVSQALEKAAEKQTLEVEIITELPSKNEISNPAYGKKPLEELILRIIAERGQAGD
jgi:hypothetical protein